MAPHGIPVDLLDRMLIVRTMPYNQEEMERIISIRAGVENIELDEEALELMGDIGSRTSLRYAVQMLTPARILGETVGRTKVKKEDILEADKLFFDGKASARFLAQSEGYMK